MDVQISNQIRQMLFSDSAQAISLFRRHFLHHLGFRDLVACEALLDLLQASPDPWIHHEREYHSAVLLSEQREYDRAESILRTLLVAELRPAQRAKTLLELAIQLDELGDWEEAARFYGEAAEAYQHIGDRLGVAKVDLNRGVSLCFQYEYGNAQKERLVEALSYHQRALALAEQLSEAEEIANNWHGIGRAHGLLGDDQQALDAFANHEAYCLATNNLSSLAINYSDVANLVHIPQKHYAAAEKALNAAINLLDEAQDELHLAEALTRRGILYGDQGLEEVALSNFMDAIHHVESIRGRLNAPAARATYRTTIDYVYRAPLSLYLARGDFAAAFNTAERARSRVLADLLANQDLSAAIPVALQQLWRSIHAELDQAYASSADRATIEQLERKLADLDRQIELCDQTYVGITGAEPMNAAAVCGQLPADTALLTYVSDNNDQLWMVVLTRNEVWGQRIPQLSVQWLQNFLSDHIDGIHRGKLIPTANGYLSPPKGLIPPLFAKLLAPAWDILKAQRTVYIIPHGPLHYVPIGALTPTLSEPPPLLADGRRVVYAPSATILLRYSRQAPVPRSKSTLALAPNDEHLQYTIGAAKRIAAGEGDAAITGSYATKQAFVEQARRYGIICFLGHAIFDQIRPMSSRLILTDGHLRAGEISRELRLQADLVILAACETGRSKILQGDEILGLPRAFLHAGAPSTLVTLWPVHEVPTRLLIEEFMRHLQLSTTADAPRLLANAQNWLRTLTFGEALALLVGWDELTEERAYQQLVTLWQMTNSSDSPDPGAELFTHPYFWSPFVLIGSR